MELVKLPVALQPTDPLTARHLSPFRNMTSLPCGSHRWWSGDISRCPLIGPPTFLCELHRVSRRPKWRSSPTSSAHLCPSSTQWNALSCWRTGIKRRSTKCTPSLSTFCVGRDITSVLGEGTGVSCPFFAVHATSFDSNLPLISLWSAGALWNYKIRGDSPFSTPSAVS